MPFESLLNGLDGLDLFIAAIGFLSGFISALIIQEKRARQMREEFELKEDHAREVIKKYAESIRGTSDEDLLRDILSNKPLGK